MGACESGREERGQRVEWCQVVWEERGRALAPPVSCHCSDTWPVFFLKISSLAGGQSIQWTVNCCYPSARRRWVT